MSGTITSILHVATRGSQLSLALYDFAAAFPGATTDAVQLAAGVKDLSRSLWQVGASQKEDARITTDESREAVADVVDQAQLVFTEVEAVVPLDMLRGEGSGTAITYGQEWAWSDVTRAKVRYLLGHLESLRLTLEVLSQAVKSVRVLEWSWQQPQSLVSTEAVSMDRLQLEGLIVDQQLAFLRAFQLFETYQQATSAPGLALITQDQGSQALTLFEEHAPNPRRLRKYQQIALASSRPTQSEAEKVALVRRVSSPYIDFLLDQWTRLRELRKQQQPTVDSDDESDAGSTPIPTPRNGVLSPLGPILTHIDDVDDDDRPPISPYADTVRRARAPASPVTSPTARSWNPNSGTYFPAAPPVRAPGTQTHSNPNSPRPSFSASRGSSQTLPYVGSSAKENQPPKRLIAWRLRVDNRIWDHENDKVVSQNCRESKGEVQMTRNVATEILATYVSEEAIKEAGYRFDRYMTDISASGSGSAPDGSTKTKMEQLFSIRWPLTFAQVEQLVERTERRYEQRYKKPRPRPHFDHHAASAPLPTPGQYLATPTDKRRSGVSRSHTLDDTGTRPRSAKSSVSSANESDSEHDRDGHGQRSGMTRTRERSRRGSSTSTSRPGASSKSKAGGTAQTLTRIAAGAGIGSLLGDVVEGIGAAL